MPGTMSRGAIQQRRPRASSPAHSPWAASLSFAEWLMNTSWAMKSVLPAPAPGADRAILLVMPRRIKRGGAAFCA